MKKERTLRCPKSPSYLLSCKKRVQVLNLRHIMAIHYEGQRRLKYLQNIPFLLLLRSVNSPSTVWKFHSFSIAQILREINFGDSKSAKSAILTHLEALNCDAYEFLHFQKVEV